MCDLADRFAGRPSDLEDLARVGGCEDDRGIVGNVPDVGDRIRAVELEIYNRFIVFGRVVRAGAAPALSV
jgi:hypothetical protein